MANIAQKVKKKPERRCAGCSEHKPKAELLRVVLSPEGEVSLDFTGKKNGRGAYLCNSLECFKQARKSRGLERSLQIKIPDEIYETLEKELSEVE